MWDWLRTKPYKIDEMFHPFFVCLKQAKRKGEAEFEMEIGIFRRHLKNHGLEAYESQILSECESKYQDMKRLIQKIERDEWTPPKSNSGD